MPPFEKKQPTHEAVSAPEEMASRNQPDSLESEPAGDSLLAPASGYKYRFDFEIGYLVKSPCRQCCNQAELPRCADGCQVLDGIHSMLSRSVSCTRGA